MNEARHTSTEGDDSTRADGVEGGNTHSDSTQGGGDGGRLEEVLAGYLLAAEAGETPDRERFIASHPNLADALRAFFADESRIGAMARPAGAGIAGAALGDGAAGTPAMRSFGDYELLEEIGRGGMGVVLRARQVGPASDVSSLGAIFSRLLGVIALGLVTGTVGRSWRR